MDKNRQTNSNNLDNDKDDIYNVVEDPRFKQCNKEAMMGLGLGIINLIWWFAWGYGLGSKPVSQYTYILGFPAWFFMSCIAGSVIFSILTVVMIDKFFKHMSLEALSDEELEKYRKEYE